MSNKLMKRVAAAAMSGILAAALAVGTGAPVLADTESSNTENQIGIDKVLKFAYGTKIPNLKFVFDVTPVAVNGEAYDKANMPLIDQLVTSYSGGDTQDAGSGQADVGDDNMVKVVSEYILDLDDVPFDHAGVYEYQVRENKDASMAANASVIAELGDFEINYSDSTYTLKVGIQNDGNGIKITDVVVEPKTKDVVKTDEEGNTVDEDGDGIPDHVDGTVGRDESSDKSTDKGKIDAAPSNPYGSTTDPSSSDKPSGNSADGDKDGNKTPDGTPDAGTQSGGDANENGDRSESSEMNGMTFTNVVTQVLGTEEEPEGGQDMDHDPTDDEKENNPDDPTTADGGHEAGKDEVTNYVFYVGKDVTGEYGDQTRFFDFTLTLTKSALQSGEAEYFAYIATRDSSDDRGVWSYEKNEANLFKPYDAKSTADAAANNAYKVTTGTPFSFRLKANQRLVFTRIGTGVGYTVTEEGAQEYYGSAVVTAGGVQGESIQNTEANKSLATKVAYTGGGKNAVDVTNENKSSSPTGIVINNLPYILVALFVAAALIAYVAMGSRKRVAR